MVDFKKAVNVTTLLYYQIDYSKCSKGIYRFLIRAVLCVLLKFGALYLFDT